MIPKLNQYISKLLPFGILKRGMPFPVYPLLYHAVGETSRSPYLKGLYHVLSPEEFEQDIDELLKMFTPIDLATLISIKRGTQINSKKPFVFFSFDDGLIECKNLIIPVLKRKGVPATFFLNSGFIGNNAFFHRFTCNLMSQELNKTESLKTLSLLEEAVHEKFDSKEDAQQYLMKLKYDQLARLNAINELLKHTIPEQMESFKPYMDKEDIKLLIQDGFTVGAHSIDHPEFSVLTEPEQLNQAVKSLSDVVSWFDLDYKVFAFPFTDVGVTTRFFDKFKEACNPDLTFGTSGLKRDVVPWNIQRIPMDVSVLGAKKIIKTELLNYWIKAPLGRNIYKRK